MRESAHRLASSCDIYPGPSESFTQSGGFFPMAVACFPRSWRVSCSRSLCSLSSVVLPTPALPHPRKPPGSPWRIPLSAADRRGRLQRLAGGVQDRRRPLAGARPHHQGPFQGRRLRHGGPTAVRPRRRALSGGNRSRPKRRPGRWRRRRCAAKKESSALQELVKTGAASQQETRKAREPTRTPLTPGLRRRRSKRIRPRLDFQYSQDRRPLGRQDRQGKSQSKVTSSTPAGPIRC